MDRGGHGGALDAPAPVMPWWRPSVESPLSCCIEEEENVGDRAKSKADEIAYEDCVARQREKKHCCDGHKGPEREQSLGLECGEL